MLTGIGSASIPFWAIWLLFIVHKYINFTIISHTVKKKNHINFLLWRIYIILVYQVVIVIENLPNKTIKHYKVYQITFLNVASKIDLHYRITYVIALFHNNHILGYHLHVISNKLRGMLLCLCMIEQKGRLIMVVALVSCSACVRRLSYVMPILTPHE